MGYFYEVLDGDGFTSKGMDQFRSNRNTNSYIQENNKYFLTKNILTENASNVWTQTTKIILLKQN